IGESEKLVRALFQVAREKSPAVIFIDEVDSLMSQRGDGEHESSRRVKTELLVQMDGVCGTQGASRILLIGATNRPQELDEAARRRFTKRIYVPLPEEEARLAMLKKNLADQSHSLIEEDFINVVKMTKGFSGADMRCLCSEAAMGAIRELEGNLEDLNKDDLRSISFGDFQSALNFVKPSVSDKDIVECEGWNRSFGTYQMD
ncbi:MAG: Fidgetin-like protein 1, partial [Paramarteilia canceri]